MTIWIGIREWIALWYLTCVILYTEPINIAMASQGHQQLVRAMELCIQALCIRRTRTRTRTLCIRRTLSRHVTIDTALRWFLLFWLFLTIGTLLLHCWYRLGRHVTIGTSMVIFAVVTVSWLFLTVFGHYYTSRHKSTKTVPIVYQQCTNCQK